MPIASPDGKFFLFYPQWGQYAHNYKSSDIAYNGCVCFDTPEDAEVWATKNLGSAPHYITIVPPLSARPTIKDPINYPPCFGSTPSCSSVEVRNVHLSHPPVYLFRPHGSSKGNAGMYRWASWPASYVPDGKTHRVPFVTDRAKVTALADWVATQHDGTYMTLQPPTLANTCKDIPAEDFPPPFNSTTAAIAAAPLEFVDPSKPIYVVLNLGTTECPVWAYMSGVWPKDKVKSDGNTCGIPYTTSLEKLKLLIAWARTSGYQDWFFTRTPPASWDTYIKDISAIVRFDPYDIQTSTPHSPVDPPLSKDPLMNIRVTNILCHRPILDDKGTLVRNEIVVLQGNIQSLDDGKTTLAQRRTSGILGGAKIIEGDVKKFAGCDPSTIWVEEGMIIANPI